MSGTLMGRLVRFALPATLVVLLSGLFLVIDTYFVSRLGPDVLLGVSLVFPLYLMVVMVFGGGLGVGLSVVVSMCLGRGDEAKARLAAGNALALAGHLEPATWVVVASFVLYAVAARWALA